jgi:hypothetical protein
MVDLKNIIKSAQTANEESHDGYPPVEKWNPDHCGDIGLEIKSDGSWHYMNSPIGRKKIVNLFARILRKEKDGSYVLVTPVEKIIIKVHDVPFIATSVEVSGNEKDTMLKFTTNTDDTVIGSKDYPIRIVINSKTKEPAPYILVRSNLEAKISRSVFYELVNLGCEEKDDFGVWSGGNFFPFMKVSDLKG